MTDETKKESTTAEAFATVLEAMRGDAGINEREAGRSALSLLERRMGAMSRALALVLEHGRVTREALRGMPARFLVDVRAALTDAPPVFTLEEVREAMLRTGADADSIQEGCTHLSALRSTGGDK